MALPPEAMRLSDADRTRVETQAAELAAQIADLATLRKAGITASADVADFRNALAQVLVRNVLRTKERRLREAQR